MSSKQHKLQKSAQPGNQCWHVPFDVWPVVKAFVTRMAERSQTAWCSTGIIRHNGKPPAKNTGACGSDLKSQQNANTYYCTYTIKHELEGTCWHFSSCTLNIERPHIILSFQRLVAGRIFPSCTYVFIITDLL